MYKVVLVDDHSLLRNGLANLIDSYENFKVLFEADNGKDFIKQLDANNLPDLVLLDITMPEMDGYATAAWIKERYPKLKILALSMMDDDYSIIKMLKSGARGYLVKNTKSKELLEALTEIIEKGFYFNEQISNKIAHSVYSPSDKTSEFNGLSNLSTKETEFLVHACSEKSYKEIAETMCISPRTVDTYRDSLFQKLNIKTRVGLVMFAIKTGLVKL